MSITKNLTSWCALFAAISLNSSSAADLFEGGSVFSRELDRDIHVQKKSDSKEYAIDYADLADVSLTISGADTSKCEDWRKAIAKNSDGSLPASFYNKTRAHLKLRVLNLNALATVAQAMGDDWTNAGSVVFGRVIFNYRWESDALANLAGPKMIPAIVQGIDSAMNSYAGHMAVSEMGVVEFDVTNLLFVCDLMQERVSLSLSADGTRSTVFHYPSTVRPNDIVEVSKNVVASAAVLKDKNVIYGQDASHAIRSAGLLGYYLQKQGFTQEIFTSGGFVKIFSKVFARGMGEPSVLSTQEAGDLVRKMATSKLSRQDFNISKSLTLKTE